MTGPTSRGGSGAEHGGGRGARVKPAGDPASAVGDAAAGTRWALAFLSAVSLILVEATRLLIAYAPPLRHPDVGARLLHTALPLLPFLAPALPVDKFWGRSGAMARLAGVAAVCAPLLALVPRPYDVLPAGLAAAAAASCLAAAIGEVNRNAVAAGVAAGLLLEYLARVAGVSPAGVPPHAVGAGVVAFQALLGAGTALLVVSWRGAPAEPAERGFERRAGGLRLRGAVAVGALLFLELDFLRPIPDVVPRAVSLALIASGLGAWVVLARGSRSEQHRSVAATLGVVAMAGALMIGWTALPGLALWVAGEAAALLLLDPALAPAGGRRSGWNLALGLVVLYGLAVAEATHGSFTFVPRGLPVWPLGGGLLLLAMLYLKPRPAAAPSALPTRGAIGAAAVVLAVAALVVTAAPG